MVKVKFDKEESDARTFSGWNWFYGILDIEGQEFEFSLCEMNTNVGGQHTSATEITWINDTPAAPAMVEQLIKNKFETEFV